MTDIDRQALRDFMATEVMGWHIVSISNAKSLDYYANENDYFKYYVTDFFPDRDSNQLDMLVDKMVDDGWYYRLYNDPSNLIIARFWKVIPEIEETAKTSGDRRLAVLLAIKAAKET